MHLSGIPAPGYAQALFLTYFKEHSVTSSVKPPWPSSSKLQVQILQRNSLAKEENTGKDKDGNQNITAL